MSLLYHVNSGILTTTTTTTMMIMMKVTKIFDSENEVKCMKTVKFSPAPVWCVCVYMCCMCTVYRLSVVRVCACV